MSFGPESTESVEFFIDETKARGPKGERTVHLGLRIWNLASFQSVDMVSGRWEGCREYALSLEEAETLLRRLTSGLDSVRKNMAQGHVVMARGSK